MESNVSTTIRPFISPISKFPIIISKIRLDFSSIFDIVQNLCA